MPPAHSKAAARAALSDESFIQQFTGGTITLRRMSARTQLLDLPLEIVQLIAGCLQPPDAASFALCNRNLSALFGSIYWKPIRRDIAEASQRKQFLVTIARDVPLWFFCHWCSNLHPRSRIGPPGPAFQPRRPLRCFRNLLGPTLWTYSQVHDGVSHYNFEFHHLQLAMEQHRLGARYGISVDSLSLVEVQESSKSDARQRLTTLLSVDARVCAHPQRLCLRIQNCVVCYHKDLELVRNQLQLIYVCHHLRDELPQLIDRWVLWGVDASKMPEAELRQCIHCNMDYQLEIDDFGSEGVLLVVTRWLDLGSGTGLAHHPVITTPLKSVSPNTLIDWCERVNPSSEQGEVRSSFEREQGGLSQRALVLQNRSYLSEENYKKEMSQLYPRVWIVQANHSTPRSQSSNRHIEWLIALGLLYSTFIGWCVLRKM